MGGKAESNSRSIWCATIILNELFLIVTQMFGLTFSDNGFILKASSLAVPISSICSPWKAHGFKISTLNF